MRECESARERDPTYSSTTYNHRPKCWETGYTGERYDGARESYVVPTARIPRPTRLCGGTRTFAGMGGGVYSVASWSSCHADKLRP